MADVSPITLANLKNQSMRTPEERSEIARKGGIKSSQKKKQRKKLKETLSMLLSLPIKDNSVQDRLKALGIKTGDLKVQTEILMAMVSRAKEGNVRAFEAIRDTLGESESTVRVEGLTTSDGETTSINIQTLNILKQTKIEGFEEFDKNEEDADEETEGEADNGNSTNE